MRRDKLLRLYLRHLEGYPTRRNLRVVGGWVTDGTWMARRRLFRHADLERVLASKVVREGGLARVNPSTIRDILQRATNSPRRHLWRLQGMTVELQRGGMGQLLVSSAGLGYAGVNTRMVDLFQLRPGDGLWGSAADAVFFDAPWPHATLGLMPLNIHGEAKVQAEKLLVLGPVF